MQTSVNLTLKISFFVLVIMASNGSFVTIVSEIHRSQGHQYMGPILLTINSIASIIAYFSAPFLNFTMKQLLEMCTVAYMLNYLLSFISTAQFSWGFFVCVGAVFWGGATGILKVTANTYVSRLSKSNLKNSGMLFGLLGMFNYASFILAGLFSYFTYLQGTEETYYVYLFLIAVVGWGIARIFIKDLDQKDQDQDDKIDSNIFKAGTNLKNVVNRQLMVLRKIYPLIPLQIMLGFVSGFYSQCLVHIIPQQYKSQSKKHLSINIMMVGVGAALASLIIGKAITKFSLTKIGLSVLGIYLKICILLFLKIYENSIFISYFLSAIFGTTFSTLSVWLSVVCSRAYGGSFEVFAVNAQIINISFFFYEVVAIILFRESKMETIMLVESILLALILIPGYLTVFKMRKLEKKQEKESDDIVKSIELKEQEVKEDKIEAQIQGKDRHKIELLQ